MVALRFRLIEFSSFLTNFAIFKNVVHGFGPGETPNKFLNIENILNGCGSVAVIFQFTLVQYCTND